MADLQAKGATSSNSKDTIAKRVTSLNARLERIADCVKRGDSVKQFADEKEMRETELKFLSLKLKML